MPGDEIIIHFSFTISVGLSSKYKIRLQADKSAEFPNHCKPQYIWCSYA